MKEVILSEMAKGNFSFTILIVGIYAGIVATAAVIVGILQLIEMRKNNKN